MAGQAYNGEVAVALAGSIHGGCTRATILSARRPKQVHAPIALSIANARRATLNDVVCGIADAPSIVGTQNDAGSGTRRNTGCSIQVLIRSICT